MRNVLRNGLLFLLSLLAANALHADLFWKVAAEAPHAPQIWTILGDDRRTIAFGYGGTWELDGTNWVKVHLQLDGNETFPPGVLVFAGGRFFEVEHFYGGYRLRLHVLDGSNWRPFVDIPGPVPSYAFGVDRLYVTLGSFGFCYDGGCNPDSSKWGSLISLSLVDGSIRAEPPPPACSGQLFVVKGKLHLLATPPRCGGVNVVTKRPRPNADGGTPFFRLDSSGWTALPPVTVPSTPPLEYLSLQSTLSTIWACWMVSDTESAAQVFDGERWTATLSLPRGLGHPVEWNGQILYVSQANRESLYTLTGSGLVPFIPNSPYRRPVKLFSAGSKLIAWSVGNPVDVLSSGAWLETSGIDGPSGNSAYVSDGQALFTLMGGNVFEMKEGWKRLPPPASSEATQGFVYQGRIGVTDLSSWPVLRLLLYSEVSGQWKDLGFPSTATFDDPDPKILQAGEDLFVAGRIDEIYRFRQGSWSRVEGTRENVSPSLRRLRIVSGSVFMVGDAKTNRVEADRLVPTFTDLPEGWKVWDVAGIQGSTFLLTTAPGVPPDRSSPLIVDYAQGSWKTVVRSSDVDDVWLPYIDQMLLEPVAGRLFAGQDGGRGWMEISRGKLLEARGELGVATISSQGEFGTDHNNSVSTDEMYGPGMLLRPVERVRKTIPAIVDAVGLGGKYRSTVFLGNFSPDRMATARLYAGPDLLPCREVDLSPGTQARLEDVVPGFVGPLTVDFDGLSDDDDGWAAARVWNESEGGTSGVALEARDAGSFTMEATSLVLPNPRTGTRTHLAAAVGSDGGRGSACCTYAHSPSPPEREWIRLDIPRGGFVQLDPDGVYTDAPLAIYSSEAIDDILPYAVRNDDQTQDGVVVQAGPRWLKPGRGTLFIPAAVSVSTDKGSFRTEMAIASADRWTATPLALQFRGDSEGRTIDATARVTIPADRVLRIEDLGAWLSSNGIPIQPDGFDGTITIDPDDGATAPNLIGYVAVLGRGPSAQGDYSTSVPIFPEAAWAANEAVVPGLLENPAFRSNLAVANPEPSGGPSVTLSVTVRDDNGLVAGRLPSITLQPGERRQLNQVLKLAGTASSGWAEVRRMSGAGRFVAYGVINDNPTGDGTVFGMVRAR